MAHDVHHRAELRREGRYHPRMDYQPAVDLILGALPNAEVVYLFGSRARAQTHRASDIDLAVLGPDPLDALARFDLAQRIAARLHAAVDLIDLRSTSTVMRVQVLEHGVVLFERNPGRRQDFEATALSAYARLNEERRAIIEDVKKSGHVYG